MAFQLFVLCFLTPSGQTESSPFFYAVPQSTPLFMTSYFLSLSTENHVHRIIQCAFIRRQIFSVFSEAICSQCSVETSHTVGSTQG